MAEEHDSWLAGLGVDVKGILGGIASAAGAVADEGRAVYGQMKEDAGYVKEGKNAVEGGIDWLEGKAKAATGWAASRAEGIPVLQQVAAGAKAAADTLIDVQGGVAKGVTEMAGGILGMGANPVDAAAGLASMAEHLPLIGQPLKTVHGAYDAVTGKKSWEAAGRDALDPTADTTYWGGVAKAVGAPMVKAVHEGKPGEAVGEAGVLVAAMFTGAGEAGAAAEGTVAVEGAVAAESAVAAEGAVAAESTVAAEGATGGAAAAEAAPAAEGAAAAEGGAAGKGAAAAEPAGADGALASKPPRSTAHAGGEGDAFELEVRPEVRPRQVVRARPRPGPAKAAEATESAEPAAAQRSSRAPAESGAAEAEDPMIDPDDRRMLSGGDEAGAPANAREAAEAQADRSEAGLSSREETAVPEDAPPRPVELAPAAERLSWLRQRLRLHVDKAIERYANETGLSASQEAALVDNPQLLPAFRGSRIDGLAKDAIMQDPELADIITAPDFFAEPDILSASLPEWFDITTQKAWLAHLRTYQLRYGPRAVPLFTH